MTQPVTTGETTGVMSGAQQAAGIRLAIAAMRESAISDIDSMLKALEAQEAAAAQMDMDAETMANIARAREALASLKAVLASVGDEVDAAMGAVQSSWAKHLPGVELNAAVGGLAKREAYAE